MSISQSIPSGIPNANEKDDDKAFDVSYAGIVRSISSSLVRNLPKIGKGKFTKIFRTGLKLKPRTVAHSTDRLKELVEFREHYFSAGEHGGGGGHEQLHADQMTKRQMLIKVILPAFVRHVLFATIVFSAYENVYDDFFEATYPSAGIVGPVLCGGIAGSLGGMFHVGWDVVANRLVQTAHSVTIKQATTVTFAHSLAQASLFGSYEIARQFIYSHSCHSFIAQQVKKLSLPEFISVDSSSGSGENHHTHTPSTSTANHHEASSSSRNVMSDDDSSFVADIVCISTAGGIAGISSELVQHWIKVRDLRKIDSHRAEIESIVASTRGMDTLRAWYRVYLPSGKHMIHAALPMSLAFMAYEYGKGKAFHHQQ